MDLLGVLLQISLEILVGKGSALENLLLGAVLLSLLVESKPSEVEGTEANDCCGQERMSSHPSSVRSGNIIGIKSFHLFYLYNF